MGIKCDKCDGEFIDSKALGQHKQAKHSDQQIVSSKVLQRMQEKEVRKAERSSELKSESRSKAFKYGGLVAIIAVLAYAWMAYAPTSTNSGSSPSSSIISKSADFILPKAGDHWHAYPTVTVCGEKKELPYPLQGIMGVERLHTHGPPENYVHIEQAANNPDDIKLGKYFDYLNVKFAANSISWGSVNVKNGDKCPDGIEGKLKVSVNGKEISDPRNLVIQDQQKIDIVFG